MRIWGRRLDYGLIACDWLAYSVLTGRKLASTPKY
jgi:hypothetical protein